LGKLEESKRKKKELIEKDKPTFKPTLNPKTNEIIKKKNQKKQEGVIKSLDLRHYQEEFLSKEIFYKPPGVNHGKKDASKLSSKNTAAGSNGEQNSSMIINKNISNVPPLFDNLNWGDSGINEKVNEINYSGNINFILNKIGPNQSNF
jgi:hypothetical protein